MKDSDQKEFKPVYIQTIDCASNDEINLVDIARILARRKKLIAITVMLLIGLATATIFLKPKTYTYTASIEIGTQMMDGNIHPLESPQALLAKISNIFIPLSLKKQRLSNPTNTTSYKIDVYTPDNSLIVIMKIQGGDDEADKIKSLLQDVSQKSVRSLNSIYESIKHHIQSQLDQTSAELRLLKNTNDNETEIAVKLSLIDKYSSQLSTLRDTHEILPASQSIEPTGTTRTLMLAIAIIISVLLGIFSAFFAEFVAKVKEHN